MSAIRSRRLLAKWLICGLLAAVGLQVPARGAETSGADGPELVLQTGHTDPIRCLALSPDGKYLLTGSDDYAAVLWEVASGRQLRRFTGHTAALVSVGFSPDGNRVLTAAEAPDNSATVWDMATGKRLTTIKASPSSGVYSARFSPDGRQVLTTSAQDSRTAALWQSDSGALQKKLDPGAEQAASWSYDAAFSGDGRYVLTGGSRYELKPSKGYVILWDLTTGTMVRKFDGHAYDVMRVALSPDGARAVSVSRTIANGEYLFEVFLWDVSTGERLRSLEGHTGWVYSVTFSPDGKQLLTTSEDCAAILWDVETGRKIHQFKEDYAVYAGIFSHDGRQVFTAGRGDVVVVWNATTGQRLTTLEGVAGEIRCVAFSADGKQVAFEHYPAGTILWETGTGQAPRRLNGSYSDYVAAFTPDGRYLLGGSCYGPSLWDVSTGKTLYELKSHDPDFGLRAIVFSADGRQILSGGYGRKPGRADPNAKEWFSELLLSDTATGARLRSFEGNLKTLTSVAISPDGRLVLGGEEFGRIVLWDASTGRQLRVLQEKTRSLNNPVAFSPDSGLAVGAADDLAIGLWDMATGRQVRTLPGHSGRLTAVTFTADGRQVLTASDDGSAALWDAASGQRRQTFQATGGQIRQVFLHPQGYQLFTYSDDGTVRVWDLQSGRELARLMHVGKAGDWLVVTPQGLFDGSEAARRQIGFRVGGRLEVVPVDRFFQDFYRPGLLAEVCKGERPRPQVEFAKTAAPSLRIAAPVQGGTVHTTNVTLQVEATDRGGGIRGPWLMQNGARVLAPGDSRRVGNTLRRSFTVPLVSGENRLEIRAASADGSWESEPATIVFVYEEPQVRPELYVLAVGINRYAQAGMNLRFAVPDAQAMAQVFQTRGPALYGQGKVHVTRLVDEQATKTGIQAALGEVARSAKAQDTMIMFLAGHGTTAGQHYYFIPHEFKNRAERLEEDIRNQGLSGDVISDGLGAVPALKRILIFDTCQSGANITVQRTSRNPFAFRGALERLSRDQGIFTIAATAATAEAQEVPQLGHGLLTYALLAGLNAVDIGPLEKQPLNAADDAFVGVREWFGYAQDKVPLLTKIYFGQEQLVGFSGQGNNFPVLPGKK